MKNVTKQNGKGTINSNISKLITATLVLTAISAATLFLTLLVGCSKDDPGPLEPDPAPVAILSGISPESGPKNTIVTIFGNHFGADASAVQVFFNDTEAGVQTVSDIQIKALVPVGANTGLIKLIVKGTTITGPEFTYVLSSQVSTMAGGTPGFANGIGEDAQFASPYGVAVDASGNVYVADAENHKIRKITPDGSVTTLAGSTMGFADGTGTSAQFKFPSGVAVDALDNVYVADTGNHKIRKITSTGEVTTLAGSTMGFADGMGMSVQFNSPFGLTVDAEGNIYVADFLNHKIRKVTPYGTVSTLAGSSPGFTDGLGMNAQFKGPFGVTLDTAGNLYVADPANNRIRKVTSNGLVSTLAGSTPGFQDGPVATAKFIQTSGVAVDAQGNVYVVDSGNQRIRKITPTGVVSTLAGSTMGFADGIGPSAKFSDPTGVAVHTDGNVYVADLGNHKIRKITQE